ncbi:MAG: hypothetical protein AAF560_30385 [Acidobacteriota bacterium]
MSEITGSLVLKLPESVSSLMDDVDAEITDEALTAILNAAGLGSQSEMLEECFGAALEFEGLEKRGEYVLVYPFDESYMELMRILVRDGAGIEIYGGISHEYGVQEYYVLARDDVKFIGHIDREGEDDADPAEVVAEFQRLVPKTVKSTFPEVFGEPSN